MITIINGGSTIILQYSTGIEVDIVKDQIESVINDESTHAVLIVVHSGSTYELMAYETQDSSGMLYIDSEVLKDDIIAMINTSAASIPLGSWDAINNVPALADGAMYTIPPDPQAKADAGYYFYVSMADEDTPANNTTIDGNNEWRVGDIVKSDGNVWIRIPVEDQKVIAESVIYNDITTQFGVDNVQDAIEALAAESRGTIDVHSDVDTSTVTPEVGNTLVWDGSNWVPGAASSGGSVMYILTGQMGPGNIPTVDGLYWLTGDITNPIIASENDILSRTGGSWSIEFTALGSSAGSAEIQLVDSNYIWDGSRWSAIDAYEPNDALLTVNVSNPLGDITSVETGASLKGKSISQLLDDILFKTEYTAPLSPYISGSSSTNLERGSTLPTSGTWTYVQRGGGAMTSYTLRYHLSGGFVDEETISSNSIGTIDISDVGSSTVIFPSIVSGNTSLSVSSAYNAGPIPTDNKGNEYPGDQITAGNTSYAYKYYYPRYPIWYGTTTQFFRIDSSKINETTDISIDPNSGTFAGIYLNESWLRSSGTGMYNLYTSNLSNTSLNVPAGAAHALIIVPPGISVSSIQESVAGNWVNMVSGTHYNSFTMSINAVDGTEPRTHTCYYIRNLSSATFPARTLRFTTTGSITT